MRTNRQVEVIVFKTPPESMRFLILKRNLHKGGWWQPITGGVQEGETDEEAAHRELREGLGVTDVIRFVDAQFKFAYFDNNLSEQPL